MSTDDKATHIPVTELDERRKARSWARIHAAIAGGDEVRAAALQAEHDRRWPPSPEVAEFRKNFQADLAFLEEYLPPIPRG